MTSRPTSIVGDPEVASRQLQLQYQLQEQQEQILQRQIREEMRNRTLQMLVRSSSSASRGEIVSPMMRHAQVAGASCPIAETVATTTANRRQSQISLLTRAERERTMTDQERRLEEAVGRSGDVVMRNVLHALGQSSSSESGGSTMGMDTDEEEEDRRRRERARQGRRGSSSVMQGRGWNGHHNNNNVGNNGGLGLPLADGAEGNTANVGGPRRSSRQWSRVLSGLWGGHGNQHGISSESQVAGSGGNMPPAATVSPTAS